MSEKTKEKDEEKSEEKSEDKTEATPAEEAGDKYETTPVIERAREEREKLEAATEAMKTENDRKEKIMAKEALGGNAEAGQEPVKKTEDEEWAEGAKERYEGTGMDPTPDNTPTEFK